MSDERLLRPRRLFQSFPQSKREQEIGWERRQYFEAQSVNEMKRRGTNEMASDGSKRVSKPALKDHRNNKRRKWWFVHERVREE